MYCLTEKQIDYILNDIRARGVTMESLQLNLLDHICCIIEQDLEPDGDFELFYAATIKTFYKNELREIENETINLLTFKNYYAMKKIMIASGAISTMLLSLGILFKFNHWPGSAMGLVLGIGIFSLVFLPLVFLLKAKENQNVKDRLIVGLATVSATLFSLAVLFKVMRWPGANVMGVATLALMGLVFLPIYFFSGIRHAETKVNTIVTSVLIVAGCGLFLSLVRAPAGTRIQYITDTGSFVRNQQILNTEQKQFVRDVTGPSSNPVASALGKTISTACEELKTYVVETETGHKTIGPGYETENTLLTDTWIYTYFGDGTEAYNKLNALKATVEQYNQTIQALRNPALQTVPVEKTVLEIRDTHIVPALNDLTQLQMAVLQNERELAAR